MTAAGANGRRKGVRLGLAVLALVVSTAGAFEYYRASSFIDLSGNLALGKPSFSSSEAYGGVAGRGNDGLISGNYYDGTCIHTNDGGSQWWTVDLGANDTVVKVVKLFNRLDGDYEKRLNGVEIRVGNKPVNGAGDQNALCTTTSDDDYVHTYPGEEPYFPTLFRCDDSKGRYVTVRLATGQPLHICEALVFGEEKKDQYIIQPRVPEEGCPAPLAAACKPEAGETREQAQVRAYMEGPIDCGGLGFFCRMKKDSAGTMRGMTGGPGDDFVNNENFGYCVDRAVDRSINWNNLGRQPRNNGPEADGHCHGSEFDDVYIGVLHDHYYRPYRGDLVCCCGMDPDGDGTGRGADRQWEPAPQYISRCDYRGRNGNDNNQNAADDCGLDMTNFIKPDSFPNAQSMCWELDNFGRPLEDLYSLVAPYPVPALDVPFCQGEGSGTDWTGCVIKVDARSFGETMVLLSPQKVEARMIDNIQYCREIYGVEISEYGLQQYKLDDLDKHGHETGFFRINVPSGQEAHIQVLDLQTCTISPVVTVTVPEAEPAEARRLMRRLMM